MSSYGWKLTLAPAIRNDLRAIETVLQEVVRRAQMVLFSPEQIDAIELSVREALLNAREHGNRNDPAKWIYVSCFYDLKDKFAVAVTDEGNGFDVDSVGDPQDEERLLSPHGRGIFLMRTLMDEVRFEQGGRRITLVKVQHTKRS